MPLFKSFSRRSRSRVVWCSTGEPPVTAGCRHVSKRCLSSADSDSSTASAFGETTGALAVVLEHHDAEVRLQAIKTLGVLGGDDATQLLEYAWAGDANPVVRDAAWVTLEQLLADSQLPD